MNKFFSSLKKSLSDFAKGFKTPPTHHYRYHCAQIIKNPEQYQRLEDLLGRMSIVFFWTDYLYGEVNIGVSDLTLTIEEVESRISKEGFRLANRKEVKENKTNN